jgi:hypothetical protein
LPGKRFSSVAEEEEKEVEVIGKKRAARYSPGDELRELIDESR